MEILRQVILQLAVRRPMSVDEYLNPEEEQTHAHYELSDEEPFESAASLEDETATEEIEMDEDEPRQPTDNEKLAALYLVISMLDGGHLPIDNPDDEERTIDALRVLRTKQQALRLVVEVGDFTVFI
ncbi:hypothetical protein BGZ54_001925 [Gamsiella multidivaricata]|nr:hypothetical protein BGZ54_001925 [Gamsiella multidivaricata]